MRRTPPDVVQLQAQPAVQAAAAGVAMRASAGVLPRRLRWDGQAGWLADPDRKKGLPVRLAMLIDLHGGLPLARRQQADLGAALRATVFAAPQVRP
jgi:hypothetical protein